MWLIGFAFLIMIYVVISFAICKIAGGRFRTLLIIIFCIVPFLLPFSFYLNPSYYEFENLCNNTNRYKIAKLEVDYVPPFSGCKGTFEVMNSKNYKGFECNYFQGKAYESPYTKSLHRFTPNEKWNSNECQEACFRGQPHAWEETCLDVCFNKTPITNKLEIYEFKFNNSDVVKNRISMRESYVVNGKNEVVTRAVNYIYYLYGNGAARILGGASGDAPTISCKVEYDIFNLDFLPVKN